jgi:hypothetical protein
LTRQRHGPKEPAQCAVHFPGNIITADRFDPVAKAVIDLYPLPNLPGATNNFFFSGTAKADTNQYDGRLDHTLTDNNRVFFRYSRREFNDIDPGPLPLPADGGLWTTTDLISDSYVANWSSVVSPSSSNELRFGLTDTDSVLDIPWSENLNSQLGIQGLADLGDDNARGMSRFTPTGYAEVRARSFWPNRNNLGLIHISDLFSNVRGRHVLKAGAEFRRESIFRRTARLSRGQMAFNRSFTEDPTTAGEQETAWPTCCSGSRPAARSATRMANMPSLETTRSSSRTTGRSAAA